MFSSMLLVLNFTEFIGPSWINLVIYLYGTSIRLQWLIFLPHHPHRK